MTEPVVPSVLLVGANVHITLMQGESVLLERVWIIPLRLPEGIEWYDPYSGTTIAFFVREDRTYTLVYGYGDQTGEVNGTLPTTPPEMEPEEEQEFYTLQTFTSPLKFDVATSNNMVYPRDVVEKALEAEEDKVFQWLDWGTQKFNPWNWHGHADMGSPSAQITYDAPIYDVDTEIAELEAQIRELRAENHKATVVVVKSFVDEIVPVKRIYSFED